MTNKTCLTLVLVLLGLVLLLAVSVAAMSARLSACHTPGSPLGGPEVIAC